MRRTSLFLAALLATAGGLLSAAGSAPHASAASAVQLRVVTANVDFAHPEDTPAKWRNLIAPNADIVFLQEAKNLTLANFVDTSTWIIRHGTVAGENDSEDRLGSAVLIRRSVATEVDDWDLVKGVDASSCPGGGIMTRWIAKIKVKLTNGRWIRVASLHMPPPRCQTGPGSPYDRMSDSVVAFVQRTDMFTVLGADWNKTVDADPNDIGKRSGLEPNGPDTGERIDGFMYSPRLANCCLSALGEVSSGHDAVRITLTVPAP